MKTRRHDEAGFTMVELLVVVIVVGLLATIAIPQFLNHRERAFTSAVQSDLLNTALLLETAATDNNGSYPLAVPAGAVSSPDVTVTMGPAATSSRICLHGGHSSLTDTFYFDSDNGGITTVAC